MIVRGLIASKLASLIYRAWHQKQSALPNDVRAVLAAADLAAERTAAYLRLVILILIGLGLPFPRSWDRKFADSPLEEAVSSELVSEMGNFPGYWEKYREF